MAPITSSPLGITSHHEALLPAISITVFALPGISATEQKATHSLILAEIYAGLISYTAGKLLLVTLTSVLI